MNDEQLLRYSRQILLPQFDIQGQQKLLDAHVLIIGLGGLGSPVAMYLAAAGVGELTLVDFDQVELSNLQRQILHRTENLQQSKVDSARDNLLALNPEVTIHCIDHKLSEQELEQQVRQVDLVIDATDNFVSRFDINRNCVAFRKPLVSGAAIRMEGQVTVFDMRQANSPCYRCLYSDQGDNEQETCSENGILAPMVGIIGSIQAMEALKLLAGMGTPLTGQLLINDSFHQEWRTMKLRKDPECPVCGSQAIP